jgi:hypothetical protein
VRENLRLWRSLQKAKAPFVPWRRRPFADCNTSTELLAEYITGQIRCEARQNFAATIRYMEVVVEEARGQTGIFRDDF